MKKKRSIVKLALELERLLTDDILTRYNNQEYWDIQIAEDFYQDKGVSGDESEKIIEILGL